MTIRRYFEVISFYDKKTPNIPAQNLYRQTMFIKLTSFWQNLQIAIILSGTTCTIALIDMESLTDVLLFSLGSGCGYFCFGALSYSIREKYANLNLFRDTDSSHINSTCEEEPPVLTWMNGLPHQSWFFPLN